MTDLPTSTTPVWFDVSTPDPGGARAFYEQVFGWSVHALGDDYALISTGDAEPGGGIGRLGPDSPYRGVVPYFPVSDVESVLARVEHLGGRRTMGPIETPTGRIAAFTDPQGNDVGLQEC